MTDGNKRRSLVVQGTAITVKGAGEHEYISLTDMLRAKEGDFFIGDWLRNRNTVEFLGVWERVHNPSFNYGEFATIRSQAGLNSYRLSVKEWVDKTGAIGLRATAGRYGGTYAHPDIAFEFAMWISPEFKVYLVQEFRRLEKVRRRAEELEDGPGAIETGQTIAYLHSWWHDNERALESLEATAAFAERGGVWAPPRLGHLLRRYRMLVAPSPETVAPLLDELHTVLRRGDGSWMATLDDLDRLKKAHGEEKFVALVAPFWGDENARRLAAVTRYGDDEDDDRQRHLDENANCDKPSALPPKQRSTTTPRSVAAAVFPAIGHKTSSIIPVSSS